MDKGVHYYVDEDAFGGTYIGEPVTLFYRISDESDKLVRMSISLAHEAVHTFGMDDVYKTIGHDRNNASICIMEGFDHLTAGDFYEAIKSGDAEPFCNSCMEAILTYTENMNIIGN